MRRVATGATTGTGGTGLNSPNRKAANGNEGYAWFLLRMTFFLALGATASYVLIQIVAPESSSVARDAGSPCMRLAQQANTAPPPELTDIGASLDDEFCVRLVKNITAALQEIDRHQSSLHDEAKSAMNKLGASGSPPGANPITSGDGPVAVAAASSGSTPPSAAVSSPALDVQKRLLKMLADSDKRPAEGEQVAPHQWWQHPQCQQRAPSVGGARGFPQRDFNNSCSCGLSNGYWDQDKPEFRAPCVSNNKQLDSSDWRTTSLVALLEGISVPHGDKPRWRQPFCGQRLAIVLVVPDGGSELSQTRKHDSKLTFELEVRAALYNLAHTYGGTEVALYVLHSAHDSAVIDRATPGWLHVERRSILTNVRSRSQLNAYLASQDFLDMFPQTHILVTQKEVLFTKRIPERMFRYPFVGAPYLESPDGAYFAIGNGVVSLRRVDIMRRILQEFGDNSKGLESSDRFVSRRLAHHEVPAPRCAVLFASDEFVWCNDGIAANRPEATAPDACRFAEFACRVEGFGKCNALRSTLGV